MRTGGGAAARVLRAVVVVALAGAALGAVGIGALSWRLAQGPLDVGWMAPWIEGAVNAPDAPTRLSIGGAEIAWQGFGGGAGRALDLRLRDVRLSNAGAPMAEVATADIALSPGALMSGSMVPRDVDLDGLRLRLFRGPDGTVSLDVGSFVEAPGEAAEAPGATVAETMAALNRPAAADGAAALPGLRAIAQLRSVRLRNAVLSVVDRRLGATLDVAGIEVDLRRPDGGGVTGTAAGLLTLGEASTRLDVRAELAEGGTRIAATMAPVSLGALARALPALAPAAKVESLLEVSATADLTSALMPRRVLVRAAAGGGSARLPTAELAFESLAMDAVAEWDGIGAGSDAVALPDRVTVSRAQLVVASPAGGWDTRFSMTGQAVRRAERLRADVALTVDHLAFADLPKLWPAAWGGQVRPWLAENITAGIARDGQVTLAVEGAADLSGLKLVEAGGTLQGDDVTIHWLRPVPPIERAQALLTLQGPDVIEIAISGARQGGGQGVLSNGVVRITGLSQKDQFLALTSDVAVPVPDLLALLRHPRLRLLDRYPLPVRNPAGTLAGKLSVKLPLEGNLDFADVDIRAQAQVAGLRLGGLVAGRDLDHGQIAIEVSQDGLRASGKAAIGSIPGTVLVEMDFRGGPPSQVTQKANFAGVATARQLAAAGLDAGGLIGPGTGSFTAAYSSRRDKEAEVRVQADLRDAALSVAGWRKAAGQPASGSARLVLRSDKLAGIAEIQAQGPGMQVRGRADMVGDKPSLLVLDPIVLGPTRGRGDIRLPTGPNQPVRATIEGSVLDISAELSRKPDAKGGGGGDAGSWVADVNFDRVLLGEGRSLSKVSAHAEFDGRVIRVLQAQSGGTERVQAIIKPDGRGRSVQVRAADGGAALRAFGLLETIVGGQLAMDGRYDDSGAVPVLSGNADLRQFHVRDAPAIGKLLQALTVYGIGEAMSGPGLAFTHLLAPFRWDGEVLELQDAQAFSASLGLTAQGRIDTARKALDLKGTIVPAYALNSALGRIPLLGGLFSAERGGGLLAVNYAVRGSPDDPAVSVNPLSALTPGFLRRLFRVFD